MNVEISSVFSYAGKQSTGTLSHIQEDFFFFNKNVPMNILIILVK